MLATDCTAIAPPYSFPAWPIRKDSCPVGQLKAFRAQTRGDPDAIRGMACTLAMSESSDRVVAAPLLLRTQSGSAQIPPIRSLQLHSSARSERIEKRLPINLLRFTLHCKVRRTLAHSMLHKYD
jgi:hypothetical protein